MSEAEKQNPVERKDTGDGIDLGGVLIAGAGLAALTIAAFLVSTGVQAIFLRQPEQEFPEPVLGPPPPPPEPRLETAPGISLERLRERENELLGTYGWKDRERSAVRIPIEKAMEIVAEEAGR